MSAAASRSHELKLSRAQHHLKQLNGATQYWIDQANNTVTEEPDPQRPHITNIWVDPPAIPQDRLALGIGDCLQCFRSALDHLAFELAATFTTPLSDDLAKQSEFPIFGNDGGTGSSRFNQRRSRGRDAGQPAPGSGLAKIAGMDPAAQTIIEGLQPYARGNAYADDPLWRLQELNRIDKHRVLHVVAASFEGMLWDVTKASNIKTLDPPPGGGYFRFFAAPIEGRTRVAEIAMIPRPVIPGKEMRMNFTPALRIEFDTATPIVAGVPFLDVLTEINNYIVSDVLPPLGPFLK